MAFNYASVNFSNIMETSTEQHTETMFYSMLYPTVKEKESILNCKGIPLENRKVNFYFCFV